MNWKVIVGGGGRRVEVYDYNANRFVVSGRSLEDEWFYATATPLPDGKVFIASGYNDSLGCDHRFGQQTEKCETEK